MSPRRAAAEERPEWLPRGWAVECRKRAKGGRVDKYYICPLSGKKLRSRLEIMEYLNNRAPDLPASKSERGAHNRLVRFVRPASKSECGGHNQLVRFEHPASKSEHGAHNQLILLTDANRPAWLPEGWLMEIRERRTFSYNNRADKYYICPSSHKKLRSRLEVMRFLNNGVSDCPASISQHGGYNQLVPVTVADRPEWLPAGWTMEIRKRRTFSYTNHSDKYYISPSGKKYRSRVEVMRYLNTKLMLDHPSSSTHGSYNLLPAGGEDQLLGWLPGEWDSEIPLQMQEASPGNSHKIFTQIEHSPSGFPRGWVKETRLRKNGGRTDSYYIDPVNGYEFRSKLDAFCYLQNRGVRRVSYRQPKTHTPEAYSLAEEFLPLATLRRLNGKRTAVRKCLFSGEESITNASMEIVVSNPPHQPISSSFSHVQSEYDGFKTSLSTSPNVGHLKQGNCQIRGQFTPEFHREELKQQIETRIQPEPLNKVAPDKFIQGEAKILPTRDANDVFEDKQFELTNKKLLHLPGEELKGQREIELLAEPEDVKLSQTIMQAEPKEKLSRNLQVPLHGEVRKPQTEIKMPPSPGYVKVSKAVVQVEGKNLPTPDANNPAGDKKIEMTKNNVRTIQIPFHGDGLKGTAEIKMLPDLGNENSSNTLVHVESRNLNITDANQSELTNRQSQHDDTEAIASAISQKRPRKRKAVNPIIVPDQNSKKPSGFAAYAVPDFKIGDQFIRTDRQLTGTMESDASCLLDQIDKDIIDDETHEKDKIKEPQTVERKLVDLQTLVNTKPSGLEASAASNIEEDNSMRISSEDKPTVEKEKPISNPMEIVIVNPLQVPASSFLSHASSESDVGSQTTRFTPANVGHMEHDNFQMESLQDLEFQGKEFRQQIENEIPPEIGNVIISDASFQEEGKSLLSPNIKTLSEEHFELTNKQSLYLQIPYHEKEKEQIDIQFVPEHVNMKVSKILMQAELKEKSCTLQMPFHGGEKMSSESGNVKLSKEPALGEGKNQLLPNSNKLSEAKNVELTKKQIQILQIPSHGDERKAEIGVILEIGNKKTSDKLPQAESKTLYFSEVKESELTKKQNQQNDTEAITLSSNQPSLRKRMALKETTWTNWASKRPMGFASFTVSDFRIGDGFRRTDCKQANKIEKNMVIVDETREKHKVNEPPNKQTVERKTASIFKLAGGVTDVVSDFEKGDQFIRTNSGDFPTAAKEDPIYNQSLPIVIANPPGRRASSSLTHVSSEFDGPSCLTPVDVGLKQGSFQVRSQFNIEYHGEELGKQTEIEMPPELETEELSNTLMQDNYILSEDEQFELTENQIQILHSPFHGDEPKRNSEITAKREMMNEKPPNVFMQAKRKTLPLINSEAPSSVSQPSLRNGKALREISGPNGVSKKPMGFVAYAISDFRMGNGFRRIISKQADQTKKDMIIGEETDKKNKEIKELFLKRTVQIKKLGVVSDFDRSLRKNSRELPTVTREDDACFPMHHNEKGVSIADELQAKHKFKEPRIGHASHRQQIDPNKFPDSMRNPCKLAGSSHQIEKNVPIVEELEEKLKIREPLVKQAAKGPKVTPCTTGKSKNNSSKRKSYPKDNYSQPTVLRESEARESEESCLVDQIDKDVSIIDELKKKLKVKEPLLEKASPFGESWTDPCIEFAFKTLTSDYFVIEGDYFKDQLLSPQILNPITGSPTSKT